MKYPVCMLAMFLISACNNSFDESVLNDPRYASGTEYETGKKIEPTVFRFGDHTFVSGYSDSGASLGGYYRNKEILFMRSMDGWFDSVIAINLNNDGIGDYMVTDAYCDGFSLYALVSVSKDSFREVTISNHFTDAHCDIGETPFDSFRLFIVTDYDNDGREEMLFNHMKMNGQLISIPCSDTFAVED